MDLSIRAGLTRMLFFAGLMTLLIDPQIAHTQEAFSRFKPFMFDIQEQFQPVDEDQLIGEIPQVAAAQEAMKGDLWSIKYWNDAYPAYRWHQLLMEASRKHQGHKNGGRVVIMHLAIYDATVAVWTHKRRHDQQAPFQSGGVKRYGDAPEYSSFICEWSAAAAAAHRIIAYYFPEQKDWLDEKLADFKAARLATGLQFPSDMDKGLAIGRQIADQYIEYARGDRTDLRWNGTVPTADSLWSGTPNPWDPMKGQWKPLTLERADQFRPGPPPTDWTADMEELRRFNAENKTSDIAWKWKSEPIWDLLIERKILEYDLNPMEAAFANAVFHTARFDGIIAAWDGKYHYWGIRPFQYDPSFKPILVNTPNFPGYPAGHTTVAGSIARVLSHLFPRDEASFYALAEECSESRFEGGVHFRTDNEVGLELGYQVGQQVIEAFTK